MPSRPPIRIVTRLLAELQTSIVRAGLPLTDGDLDRFAMLSLIVGHASRVGPAGCLSVKSLADSMSKPYETTRRQVGRLIESGLCVRRRGGIGLCDTPAAAARLAPVTAHVHDAFVRFVADLRALGVDVPEVQRDADYQPAVAVGAAADLMLSVLDGNLATHRDWLQLVIFSSVLSVSTAGFARDPARALEVRDERTTTPPGWLRPVRAAALARLLGLPETSVRRQLARMAEGGIIAWRARGYVVRDAWLNDPPQVAVSRASHANVRRILIRAGAAGFPLASPADAYLRGRPADVAAG